MERPYTVKQKRVNNLERQKKKTCVDTEEGERKNYKMI